MPQNDLSNEDFHESLENFLAIFPAEESRLPSIWFELCFKNFMGLLTSVRRSRLCECFLSCP